MAINLEMLPTRPYLIGIFWMGEFGGGGGGTEVAENKERRTKAFKTPNHVSSKFLQAGFICKEIVTSQNKIKNNRRNKFVKGEA